MTVPINSFYPLHKDATKDDIPRSINPFFLLAQEGLFLRKNTVLGVSTIKVDAMPKHLGKLGYPRGFFSYDAPHIPEEICAQIVDFFRRIWDKHKAEAEVLLTARIEKEDGFPVIKEWRVFIPTQKVSGGGVESVYEPSHIAKDHQVVGTMHSHCNFSAYHSGTDTGDAKGMDGIHFTIGHVDKEKPQVVSMVSMNGVNIDFDPAIVAKFENLKAATAPAWWDNYVIPTKDLATKHHIVGFDKFEKYERKPSLYGIPGQTAYAPSNYQNQHHDAGYWNRPESYGAYKPATTPGIKTLKEIQEQEANKNLLPADTRSLKSAITEDLSADKREVVTDEDIAKAEDEYWEDVIDMKLRDLLFDGGLLTDDDIDGLAAAGDRADTFLRRLMFVKLKAARDALFFLGIETEISFLDFNNPRKIFKFKKKKGVTSGKRNKRRN